MSRSRVFLAVPLAATLMLTACNFKVPASDRASGPVDPALIGVWESQPDKDSQDAPVRAVIYRWNDQEYFIHYGAGAKDGLYYRAWAVEPAGVRLLQLQCLGNSAGQKVEERPYQLAKISLKDDTLEVRLINDGTVGKDHATSAALVKAIEEKKNDPKLFSDEPAKFVRVKVNP